MATRSSSAGHVKVLLPPLALAGEPDPGARRGISDRARCRQRHRPAAAPLADVLKGDTWLTAPPRRPDALLGHARGARRDPVGNFPSFRGQHGRVADPQQLQPRSLHTGSRRLRILPGVHAHRRGALPHLRQGRASTGSTPRPRIRCTAASSASSTSDGNPVNPLANKDLFDLASLGLAYGMYFNVTRDPAAEADLLAVRDLLFDKVLRPCREPQVMDSLTLRPAPPRSTRAATAGTSPTCWSPGPPSSCRTAELAHRPDAAGAVQERPSAGHSQILIARHKNRAGVQPVVVLGPHPALRPLQRRNRPTSVTTSRATR